jgi:hypothetical protein
MAHDAAIAGACVVDAAGQIVRAAKVRSERAALVALFAQGGLRFARIALEAGPLAQWLHAERVGAGLPAILLETRHVRHVLGPAQPDPWGARGAGDPGPADRAQAAGRQAAGPSG